MLTKENRIFLTKPGHETLTHATAETIRGAINDGKFPPGSQLPPEVELIDILGVSRTTLREALRILIDQGFIVRQRGRGTFVREQPIVKDLSINFGITEMISQAGFSPGTQYADFRIEKASTDTSAALRIDEEEPVLVLDRVRTANKQPVVWTLDIVPVRLFGERIPTSSELVTLSYYKYLESTMNVHFVRGEAYIRPILANSEIAEKLEVKKGDPILLILQTDYTDTNQPILYSIEYHLDQKFSFLVHRKGPGW